MKTSTLIFLASVLIGIGLAVGAAQLRACSMAATEAEAPVLAPALMVGPLRHLPAANTGRVWELYVQPGSVVKRGQLLAKLAVPLHTVSQQHAEIELQQAVQHHKQLQEAAPGKLSAQALTLAAQRVAASRQRLAALPRQLAFVFVQAPAAGTVMRLPVRAGTYVSDSTTLVSLGNPADAEEVATK